MTTASECVTVSEIGLDGLAFVFDSMPCPVVATYDTGKLKICWPELGGKASPYYYDVAGVKTICKCPKVSCPDYYSAEDTLESANTYSCPYGHADELRIDLVACWHAKDVGYSHEWSNRSMCVDVII